MTWREQARNSRHLASLATGKFSVGAKPTPGRGGLELVAARRCSPTVSKRERGHQSPRLRSRQSAGTAFSDHARWR